MHPSPEEFTGLPTYQISRQIRCETRDAAIDEIIDFLADERNKTLVNEEAHKIGLDLHSDRDLMRTFRPTMLKGSAKSVTQLIWSTGVAYNYDLEMTEINKNDFSLGLIKTPPTANRTFGFGANLDLQRSNTRLFTTTNTLGKLIAETPPEYCTERYRADRNIMYPIAGRIGILPVIKEFVRLAIFGDLTGNGVANFTKPSGPAQLAEQLVFTTTLDFTANPKLTFAPAGAASFGLHLSSFGYSGEASRKDLHKLTMGLFVPTKLSLASLRTNVLSTIAGVPSANLVSAPTASAAEAGALRAVNELLTLRLFQLRQNP